MTPFWILMTIIVVASTVVYWWLMKELVNPYGRVLAASVAALGTAAIVGLIFAVILLASSDRINEEWVETSTSTIYSINTDSTTSGSFFLGCGTINEHKYFYSYEQTEEGIRLTKWDMDSTYMREVADLPEGTGQVIRKNFRFNRDWHDWWHDIGWHQYAQPGRFILRVPQGTIVRDFVLK